MCSSLPVATMGACLRKASDLSFWKQESAAFRLWVRERAESLMPSCTKKLGSWLSLGMWQIPLMQWYASYRTRYLHGASDRQDAGAHYANSPGTGSLIDLSQP